MLWVRLCIGCIHGSMRIKDIFMCPFESAWPMATYMKNYGAGKPERIWMGARQAPSSDCLLSVHFLCTDVPVPGLLPCSL